MAASSSHLHLLLLLLLLLPISIASSRHKLRLPNHHLHSSSSSPPPTTFFEVDRPIRAPPGSVGPCSTLLLSHSFGFTYTKPPVTAPYSPPPCLVAAGGATAVSLAVLKWRATCAGRQFDRIFGVWLGGAELLRSCTAEPIRTGIVWSVSRDVTRYASLLAGSNSSTLAVYLGNLVDSTYTGVYHVNLTLHLYFHPPASASPSPSPSPSHLPNLIVPISRSLPLNEGLWFPVQNSTSPQSKLVSIPSNAYRAVLEIFVSFHSDDEFWYTNPPNDYIAANNLTDVAGNGPFREVVATIDGDVVGAVCPFTVIYTGGINPLLWRPITGIGSFNLPSYDIEVTPFLGKLLDGKAHEFGFGVTDALDVWYVDANLHLWLDHKSPNTIGGLIKYDAPKLASDSASQFSGLDGQFTTSATRHVSATGWVKSSHGKITTTFYQRFNYTNTNVYRGNASVQVVNQTIDANSGVYVKHASAVLYSQQVHQSFPLYVYTGTKDQADDSYTMVAHVKLGFNEKKITGGASGFGFSSLRNVQSGWGNMRVKKNLVISGLGRTHEVYRYEGTDGCYFRDVSSKNYTIISDRSDESCVNKSLFGGRKFFVGKWDRQPTRRTSLGTKVYKTGKLAN